MTATLEVRYIAGRAHGTPWGTSHNEGTVEFPPSPWRLLRALVSTWFERAPEIPEATVRSLVTKLAKTLPTYRVPPFAGAHARHYFPESAHKEGIDRATAKVLDAFVALDPNRPLVIDWGVELDKPEREALERLAGLVPYIGRAEALTDMQLVEESAALSDERIVQPGVSIKDSLDPIWLLGPSAAFSWESLLEVPWKLRHAGYTLPPGAERHAFTPSDPLVWDRTKQRERRPAATHVIQWSLQAQGKVPITAAVAYCETLRAAVMRAFKDAHLEPGWELTGKDDGVRTTRHHQHAHYLPIAKGKFLEGLIMWVPAGLDEERARLAGSVRKLTNSEREGLSDFREARLFLQHSGAAPLPGTPPFTSSAIWQTVTPYAPPRFVRTDGRMMRSLHEQVSRDLNEVGFPPPLQTDLIKGDLHPLDFRRHRIKERLRDSRTSFHLRVHFPEAVAGPMSIGALSHFGLGHFTPVGDKTPEPEVVGSFQTTTE